MIAELFSCFPKIENMAGCIMPIIPGFDAADQEKQSFWEVQER